MKKTERPLLAGMLVATMALLGGCAVPERPVSLTLPEPKDVPREKWSDAMQVMEAMGISGQHDLPREQAGSGPSLLTSMGAASLVGNSKSPVRLFQAAAWVPASQANSPEAASALALKRFNEARLQAFPAIRSPLVPVIGRYPSGSGREFATFSDIIKRRPVPFTAEASIPPAIIGTEKAYGPIFIEDGQFGIDAMKNDISVPEAMVRLSKSLPGWFYFYHPDQDFRDQIPGQIISAGRVMYFIGK